MQTHSLLKTVYVYGVNLFLIMTKVQQIISSSTTLASCPTNRYTSNGECCQQCPPGEGVVKECSISNTLCDSCRTNHTFSSEWSLNKCKSCKQCGNDAIVINPCNSTHDTICRCQPGYFLKPNGWQCSQCGVCPPGFGTVVPCLPDAEIQCEACIPGKTFSDVITKASTCKPCTRCTKGVKANCTRTSDTVCSGLYLQQSSSDEGIKISYTQVTPTSNRVPSDAKPIVAGISAVPVYCVLLSALIVGLLIYVLFKRWSFQKMKQVKQNNKMKRSNTSTTDLEKGCSSNESMANPSDNHRNGHVSSVPLMSVDAATPYKDLHSDRKLQIEEDLMRKRKDKNDWRGLAKQLNFKGHDRKQFCGDTDTHSNPAHNMLNCWVSRDGDKATVRVLMQALKKIGREDLAQSIPIHSDAI